MRRCRRPPSQQQQQQHKKNEYSDKRNFLSFVDDRLSFALIPFCRPINALCVRIRINKFSKCNCRMATQVQISIFITFNFSVSWRIRTHAHSHTQRQRRIAFYIISVFAISFWRISFSAGNKLKFFSLVFFFFFSFIISEFINEYIKEQKEKKCEQIKYALK